MKHDFQKQIRSLGRLLTVFGLLLLVLFLGLFYVKNNPDAIRPAENYEALEVIEETAITLDEDIIDKSGFINDVGVTSVIQNCTSCHSAKLVTQNRMSKEGWEATIRWMQETQNLWDLGGNHEKIVSYLAKNYGPERKGRRQKLTNVAWYELK